MLSPAILSAPAAVRRNIEVVRAVVAERGAVGFRVLEARQHCHDAGVEAVGTAGVGRNGVHLAGGDLCKDSKCHVSTFAYISIYVATAI